MYFLTAHTDTHTYIYIHNTNYTGMKFKVFMACVDLNPPTPLPPFLTIDFFYFWSFIFRSENRCSDLSIIGLYYVRLCGTALYQSTAQNLSTISTPTPTYPHPPPYMCLYSILFFCCNFFSNYRLMIISKMAILIIWKVLSSINLSAQFLHFVPIRSLTLFFLSLYFKGVPCLKNGNFLKSRFSSMTLN